MAAPDRSELHFVKMEGVGNDYIFVDGMAEAFDEAQGPAAARVLADRHLGVGGDGLIVLGPGRAGTDCRMSMWNADGSRGAMCGNGLRCLAKLAHDLGHVRRPALVVDTDVGPRAVELVMENSEVVGARADLGVLAVATPAEVAAGGRRWRYLAVDAGNPHAVVFGDIDPGELPVAEIGAAFQSHHAFPDGVNVELVGPGPGGGFRQRTFERGSGETLACGTGAAAVAAAAWASGRHPGPSVAIQLRGGVLTLHQRGAAVVMEGPARTVFTGQIAWPVRSADR